MKIYNVSKDYIDNLSSIDSRVRWPKEDEHERPYAGLIFEINHLLYFAPLTHIVNLDHKDKIPLEWEKERYGSIDVLHMIPIPKGMVDQILWEIDWATDILDSDPWVYQYAEKICMQEKIINIPSNISKILDKARKVYIRQKYSPLYKELCCDFPKLEEYALKYKKGI